MTDISFNCPKCTKSLVIDSRGAGRTITCPDCRTPVIVPTPASAAQPIVVPEPMPVREIRQAPQPSYAQPQPQLLLGTKKRKSESFGVGCLIQGVGVLFVLGAFAEFPLGLFISLPIGLVLLGIGSAKASYLICSECGTTVQKTAKICPACRAQFVKR